MREPTTACIKGGTNPGVLMALCGPQTLADLSGPLTAENDALVAAYGARIRFRQLDDMQLAAVAGISPGFAGDLREVLEEAQR